MCDAADATALVDGKVAKLRASCDACNESKVRCSQAKPRCARCDRQGIACVYGLSRRSHKNAPRIGAAAPRWAVPPRGGPGSGPAAEERAGPTAAFPGDLDCAAAFVLPAPPVDASPELALYAQRLAEQRLAEQQLAEQRLAEPADLPGALDAVEDVSMAGYDLLGHYLSLPSPDAAPDGPPGEPAPEPGGCGCSARVLRQLVSMPLAFGDGGFDAQLSQLRHAINVSEDCIGCECTARDEITMMTISILVGRVVEGFETTLARVKPSLPCSAALSASSASSASSPGAPSPGLAAPRLSWGVLQIEPDEEDELKQHLWLLQFRKLQRVLRLFNASVGRLRSAHGSGNSAHVMACQCIHMWLAQRADGVRDRYQARTGPGGG